MVNRFDLTFKEYIPYLKQANKSIKTTGIKSVYIGFSSSDFHIEQMGTSECVERVYYFYMCCSIPFFCFVIFGWGLRRTFFPLIYV